MLDFFMNIASICKTLPVGIQKRTGKRPFYRAIWWNDSRICW